MNKEELRNRINELPLFEKREVKVAKSTKKDETEWQTQKQYAICETDGAESLAYVGERYNLMDFKDIFHPILDGIEEEFEGKVISYGGFAMMTLFPKLEELKDGKNKFGIVAMNSVDLSSSIIVRFCVDYDGKRITIPPKVAGLKKQHTGKAVNLTKDYITFIGGVKQAWARIITEFPKYDVVEEIDESVDNQIEFGTVIDELNLGKRATKHLKGIREDRIANGKQFTLWDSFELALEKIAEGEYKSEVHKQRKIDSLCQKVFDYALVLGI